MWKHKEPDFLRTLSVWTVQLWKQSAGLVYGGFTSYSSKMNLQRLTEVDSSYDPDTHYPGICCTYEIGETRSIEEILGKDTWDNPGHLKSEKILIVFTI